MASFRPLGFQLARCRKRRSMDATRFSPNADAVPKLPSFVKSAPTFVITTDTFVLLISPAGYLQTFKDSLASVACYASKSHDVTSINNRACIVAASPVQAEAKLTRRGRGGRLLHL